MNKIYSLKYSHITGGLVAVSELTKKSFHCIQKKTQTGILCTIRIRNVVGIKCHSIPYVDR